jgi:CheY-like chemotaxis protein
LSLRGELEADTGMLVASSPVVDTREDRMRMLLFSAQHELCARVATEAQARDIDLSTTGSVQEARALCEARHPGIVLLDLTLPASDVQSAYTLLSTDPASDGAGSIPVLALADGKAFAERVEVARQGGQDALLAIGGAAVAPVAECLTQPGTANVHAILRVAVALSDRWLLAGALAYGDSPDPAIRALVAELAGAVGGGQATEVLLQMLSDQAPVVRAAAAQGLGRLEYWPAGRALRLALTDSAWVVRQRAALTLRAFGAPGVLLFCGALEDPDRFAREMARQVLDLPDTAGSA